MKQCLVIELWWLGDATLMTSVLRGLLADGWKVTVLAKPQTRAFLDPVYPQLDWIEFEAPWTVLYGKYKLWRWPWREIFRVLRDLRGRRFDAALSIRWDPREHFLLWLAGIRRRIGFKTPWSFWFLNEPISGYNPRRHRVEDWWKVQRRLGHPTATCFPPRLTAEPALREQFRARFDRDPRPVLAIHCGARIALRRWPVACFRELISHLRREFDFQLVLFPDLDGYGSELRNLADHTFTGLTVAGMLAALEGVAHLICNDSGPSHLADALGIPVIAIFGPGSPEKLRPFHPDNLVVIRDNCPYHPCSDYCRFSEPYCLTQLVPALVWSEIRGNLLARGRIPRLASLSFRDSGEAATKVQANPASPSAPRLRILQIFNRYLHYGGEESSIYRIGNALQSIHDVEYFLYSTIDVTGDGAWSQWKIPWKAMHNAEILTRLDQYRKLGGFDAWLIHNIFPIMSPVVYEKALEWKIPIVHYLHNYRLSCVNGFFLNHGQPCQRCLSGNFWPAFQTACWHESHLQSGWMGLITNHIRRLPLFERVFQWIAVSEAQKREHVRIGIPESKIRVIYHFLEPENLVLPASRSSTAIFVGRLSAEKGVSRLLGAWKLIQGGDRKLLLVGDGPERAALERQAAGLKGVVFTGFMEQSRQRQFWREALFSVVPSIWMEPFGMIVLESWSHGRPVVAHKIGALPELIQDGINGSLCNPDDPGDLAHKMENLFLHPEQSQTMGLAGRLRLETEFNQDRWLRETTEIYSQLYHGSTIGNRSK